MPKKLPLHVSCERSRHGKVRFYFRVGKGKRVRLPDKYPSPEFDAAYRRALAQDPPKPEPKEPAETLAWLINRYRETNAFQSLAISTRRQRDNIFRIVIKNAGHHPYSAITRRDIVKGRDSRLPAAAGNFLKTMRGLFQWAHDAGFIDADPTAGVKKPALRSDGFAVWTDEDVEAYERRWPHGTKERVWLHVLLYTGLRRGDAVRLGKQHVKDGVATIKTEKTGMVVTIPILPALEATLATGPTADLAFICGDSGGPLTKESFGNMFRKACNAAGVEKSAHGLRKIGAVRAAESGLTVNEIEALFGWSGGRMAAHYTRSADRKRLALGAAEKIKNAHSPHPKARCGENREKTNQINGEESKWRPLQKSHK